MVLLGAALVVKSTRALVRSAKAHGGLDLDQARQANGGPTSAAHVQFPLDQDSESVEPGTQVTSRHLDAHEGLRTEACTEMGGATMR